MVLEMEIQHLIYQIQDIGFYGLLANGTWAIIMMRVCQILQQHLVSMVLGQQILAVSRKAVPERRVTVGTVLLQQEIYLILMPAGQVQFTAHQALLDRAVLLLK
jgi:hypothetical protein